MLDKDDLKAAEKALVEYDELIGGMKRNTSIDSNLPDMVNQLVHLV